MRRMARWCVTHRLAVIAAWIVVLIGSVFIQSSTGSNYSSGNKLSGTQSATAQNLLQRAAPGAAVDQLEWSDDKRDEVARQRLGPDHVQQPGSALGQGKARSSSGVGQMHLERGGIVFEVGELDESAREGSTLIDHAYR